MSETIIILTTAMITIIPTLINIGLLIAFTPWGKVMFRSIIIAIPVSIAVYGGWFILIHPIVQYLM